MDTLDDDIALLKQKIEHRDGNDLGEESSLSKEDELIALIIKQSQTLKVIREDVNSMHKHFKGVESALDISCRDYLKKITVMTNDAVSRIFSEKLKPELLEKLQNMERRFLSFHQQPHSFKETMRAYGLIFVVSFLSALSCAASFQALLPQKQIFSAYTTELLGYGHTLKKAWPYLSDKEKKRIQTVGEKRKKGS